MVQSVISGVRLAGLVAAVPAGGEDLDALAGRIGCEAARRIAAATGIAARRIAPAGQTTADLAVAAGAELLARLGWPADTVDLMVLVTQTPDQMLPASACLIHHRLGLGPHAAVFDLTAGCSGFVYGLWTAAALLQSLAAPAARGLLLVGDTTARLCDPDDRAVAPLFGDAAAAAALVRGDGAPAPPIAFDLGSDGAGAPYLAVAGGAMRAPAAPRRLVMDGTQVFAFTLRQVPDSLARVLDTAGWTLDDVDLVVLHQANQQMIRHLGHKIGARPDQLVIGLSAFGNTSSASIPLALAVGPGGLLTDRPMRLLLSGFGGGWSWASATIETACPPSVARLIEVAADGTPGPVEGRPGQRDGNDR